MQDASLCTLCFFCSINDAFRELLEAGVKPTVAAISGMALGGGLEATMACNARLCSPGKCCMAGRLRLLFNWDMY